MPVNTAESARAPSLMTTIATVYRVHIVLGARQGLFIYVLSFDGHKIPRGRTVGPFLRFQLPAVSRTSR